MRSRGLHLFSTVLLLGCGQIALAQPVELVSIVDSITSGGSAAYSLQRCAALFDVMARDKYRARLNNVEVSDLKKDYDLFVAMLISSGAEDLGTEKSEYELLFEIGTISELYERRFTENELASGHPWKHDTIWNQDHNLCKAFGRR